MKKILWPVLLWTFLLAACTLGVRSPEAPPPTPDAPTSLPASIATTESPAVIIPLSTTQVVPPAKLAATLSTPHIDQGPDGAVTAPPTYPRDCGYQWAYQDLPDLSSAFLNSIQALQPKAQASAFGFGENCVYADGTATFIPMETDFNVTIPVSDPGDTNALGEWIVKIMQVIENIPPDQIVGPRPGRVGIMFEANGQRQGVTFYIDQYKALPSGLTPAEIYQALKSLQ